MQITMEGRRFDIPAEAIAAIAEGKKIVAIKIFREKVPGAYDLRKAKELADRIHKLLIEDGGVPTVLLESAQESMISWMQDVSRRLIALEAKYAKEKETLEKAKEESSSSP